MLPCWKLFMLYAHVDARTVSHTDTYLQLWSYITKINTDTAFLLTKIHITKLQGMTLTSFSFLFYSAYTMYDWLQNALLIEWSKLQSFEWCNQTQPVMQTTSPVWHIWNIYVKVNQWQWYQLGITTLDSHTRKNYEKLLMCTVQLGKSLQTLRSITSISISITLWVSSQPMELICPWQLDSCYCHISGSTHTLH